ncbi:MAG: Holliday junction branch migration protein RuvA [Desulfobacteraceae bacterium]
MIAFIRGRLLEKTPRSVIIENSGLGYEVAVPLTTFYALPEPDEEVALYVYMHVREDALTLFGFHDPMEKAVFMLLISVSGIGPRLACNVLSGIGPRDILEAMAEGDSERLRAIPGVGKKTAERIALELKERASVLRSRGAPSGSGRDEVVASSGDSIPEEAVSALINLGYPARLAKQAVERASQASGCARLEDLIRESLKILAA